MARDLIYYFDKLSFRRYELGEIQSDFNMSFVIDGTKDSAKVEVFSFNENVIEPYTIIWHEKTNTWWIVSNDRVTRFQNDVGFAYTHELELYGAIELLNARDLTDCGFNDDTYTMEQFLQRLFSLSNFEYKMQTQTSINLNKMVDFIKTFENYTLLSAIREFLDAYNSTAKLTFNTMEENNNTYIDVRTGKSNIDVVYGIGEIETFGDGSANVELELDNAYGVDELYEKVHAYVTIYFVSGNRVAQDIEGKIWNDVVNQSGRAVLNISFNYADLIPQGETIDDVDLEDFAVYLKSQGIGANLIITPKTGDYSLETHDSSHFDYTKEIKTMNKSSFGTCVVSNAENVISTQHKTYPSIGSVRLSSTTNEINHTNAVIRLPSKVYKANWIKIISPLIFRVRVIISGDSHLYDKNISYFPLNRTSMDAFIEKVCEHAYDVTSTSGYVANLRAALNAQKDSLKEEWDKAGTITLYNGNKLVPYFGAQNNQQGTIHIEKGDDVPYMAKINNLDMGFYEKADKEILPNIRQGIQWERGSNIISGFDIFSTQPYISGFSQTDLQQDKSRFFTFTSGGFTTYIEIYEPTSGNIWLGTVLSCSFIIDYIPMTDMKVKVDNSCEKKDVHLYNQNGKITDNVALSKLLNSYSKEISSDNVTRYMAYHRFSDIPKIGSFVYFGNNAYVINNISMDFVQNESRYNNEFAYYIECEFTMSKYVATKSLMVNPNTNIRDYGIPQNFNVKRKQLYRDYYELSYGRQSGANKETPYLATRNVFNFGINQTELCSYIGIIKLGYQSKVENEYQWYYQLETTTYYLNKMIYTILDFSDNNIVGYGSQNVFSGFDISRIINNLTDALNTPISYVDDKGKVKSIDLLLCTNDQITSSYNEYQDEQSGGTTWEGSLYNYSVFIPQEIYNKSLNNHTIKISEPSYKKDAIEVPVFEYACQIDDSDDVLIGDNILTQHSGFIYFYTYIMADDGQTFTQENAPLPPGISYSTVYDAVRFSYLETSASKYLDFEIYTRATYDSGSNTMNYVDGPLQFTKGRDYAVYRIAKNFATGEEKKELMFIIHKLPDSGLYTNECVRLTINHYKLK